MLFDLDEEVARGALFDRHRLQERLSAAPCQVELLDLEDLGPRALHDRGEGMIQTLKIPGPFDDNMWHVSSSLHMVS